MKDKRNEILAQQLIDYSLDLKKGEVLYLEIKGKETLELGKQIIRLATDKGVIPFWYYNDESLIRQWVRSATDEQHKEQAALHMKLMERANAYIGLRGSDNPFDLADIPQKQIDNLRLLVNSNADIEVSSENFAKGDNVEVVSGALVGLTGELIKIGSHNRFVVRIDRLDQNLILKIPRAFLKKI